jgi:ABC-2 type transport system ATP-binding protein
VSAVAVEGVSHRFGARPALHDLSFALREGSFNVLVGPNGAGKTTLLALLAGLYAATAGRIVVLGRDLARSRGAALASTGVVFQEPALDLDLTPCPDAPAARAPARRADGGPRSRFAR